MDQILQKVLNVKFLILQNLKFLKLNFFKLKEHTIKKKTKKIWVSDVPVGGDAPISVQSMTNTETTDVRLLSNNNRLEDAGADIVKFQYTEAAEAFKEIKKATIYPCI